MLRNNLQNTFNRVVMDFGMTDHLKAAATSYWCWKYDKQTWFHILTLPKTFYLKFWTPIHLNELAHGSLNFSALQVVYNLEHILTIYCIDYYTYNIFFGYVKLKNKMLIFPLQILYPQNELLLSILWILISKIAVIAPTFLNALIIPCGLT